MTIEEKKNFLKGYKVLVDKLKSLDEQKQSIIETMISVKAMKYDDMPKGNHQSDLSDYMVSLERIMNMIDDKRSECIARKVKIESAIIKIEDGIESDILRKKYIQFKSWEVICTEIGYSWKHTHRIHSKALKNIKINNDIE